MWCRLQTRCVLSQAKCPVKKPLLSSTTRQQFCTRLVVLQEAIAMLHTHKYSLHMYWSGCKHYFLQPLDIVPLRSGPLSGYIHKQTVRSSGKAYRMRKALHKFPSGQTCCKPLYTTCSMCLPNTAAAKGQNRDLACPRQTTSATQGNICVLAP